MKIKTKEGVEVEINSTEMSHLGIKNCKDVNNFVRDVIKLDTKNVGFSKKSNTGGK